MRAGQLRLRVTSPICEIVIFPSAAPSGVYVQTFKGFKASLRSYGTFDRYCTIETLPSSRGQTRGRACGPVSLFFSLVQQYMARIR